MPKKLSADDRSLGRLIDANLNRLREALRVCEEFARFVWHTPGLARKIQRLKNQVASAAASPEVSGFSAAQLVGARDVRSPEGRDLDRGSKRRYHRAADIWTANLRRASESARVLEEACRRRRPQGARRFAKLRYELYHIEKEAVPRLSTVSHRR